MICYSFPKMLPQLVAAEQVIKMTERVTEEGLLVVSGWPRLACCGGCGCGIEGGGRGEKDEGSERPEEKMSR